MKLQVVQSDWAAERVRHIVLASPDGGELPAFNAGAHLRFQLQSANGEPLQREYSLCNHPAERLRYEVAVLLDPAGRGGSAAMHRLAVGETVEADPPANGFALADDPRPALMIAGGIGITPLLCMARVRVAGGQPVALHYAARSHDRMAFHDAVAALPGSVLHLDGGDPARGLNLPALLQHPDRWGHLYVCGPAGLIAAVLNAAAQAAWPTDRVHFESFTGAVARSGDQPIRLELRASGRHVDVAADESILDALIRSGLDPLHDCRRGECGMCVTPVLDGVPDHRDQALTRREHEAGDVICTCVSRARTPHLVLDL